MIREVNWYDEGLDKFYNDDNNGFIYGLYYYDDPEDFPSETEWYASESDKTKALKLLEEI